MRKSIEIGLIDPNPFVRRQELGDIDALAASMQEHGQVTPLRVRPSKAKKGRYETGDGYRRTLAGKKLEWKVLECDVEDMSDVELLVAAGIPYMHSKPPTAPEEAALFGAFVAQGLTIDQIALLLSAKATHVAKRLALLNLDPAVLAAIGAAPPAQHITLEVGTMIARLPLLLQKAALDMVAGDEFRAPLAGARARELIIGKYTLKLASACFNPDDEALVPEAGRCAPCPKRTGQQPLLFDVEEKDLCTDEGCFGAKTEATWKREIAKAKADGRAVIDEPKKLKKLFPFPDSDIPNEEYVNLGAWADVNRGLRWRDVIKDHDVATVLALSPKGPAELADRAPAVKLLEEIQKPPKDDGSTQKAKEKADSAKAKKELDRRITARVVQHYVASIEVDGLRIDHWKHLARRLVNVCEVPEVVVARRDCGRDGFPAREALVAWIEQHSSIKLLQGLVFEMLETSAYDHPPTKSAGVRGMCELAGVELDAVREELKGEDTKEAVRPKAKRKKAAA